MQGAMQFISWRDVFFLLLFVSVIASLCTFLAMTFVLEKHFLPRLIQVASESEVRSAKADDQLHTKDVVCQVWIQFSGEDTFSIAQTMNINGGYVNSLMVEKWLSDRNLMMTPQSTDFKATRTPTA